MDAVFFLYSPLQLDGNEIKTKKKKSKHKERSSRHDQEQSESESDFTDTEDSTTSNQGRLWETPSLLSGQRKAMYDEENPMEDKVFDL